MRSSLAPHGMYLRTYPGPTILRQMLRASMIGKKRAVVSATGLLPIAKRRAFLDKVINLVDTGALRTIVDSSYPPERVRDAYRRPKAPIQRGP